MFAWPHGGLDIQTPLTFPAPSIPPLPLSSLNLAINHCQSLSSLPPAVPSILPLPITCTASGRMDAFKLLVKSHHNDTTFELRVIPGKEDNVTVVSGSFELEHAEEHGGLLEVKVWGV